MKRVHVNNIFTVIYKDTKWDGGDGVEGRDEEVEEEDELGRIFFVIIITMMMIIIIIYIGWLTKVRKQEKGDFWFQKLLWESWELQKRYAN